MSQQFKEGGDEVGSHGHSSRLSIAAEAETSKKIPNQSRRSASSSAKSSKVSVSSWPQGFDLRRAFLIGRRGSPSTPVPSWKVTDNSALDAHHHRHWHQHLKHNHAAQGLHISARKLAASLWELQRLHFPEATKIEENLVQEPQQMSNNASPIKQASTQHGQHISPASSRISKGSHKRLPVHLKFGHSGKTHSRRERCKMKPTMPATSASKRKSSFNDQIIGDSSITSPSKSLVSSSKDAFSNLGCGPMMTSELLKVLNHVWSLEEQHALSMSSVGALRQELEQAQAQLQELLSNEESHCKEVDNISKRIAEERALWHDQHKQVIRIAVQSIKKELENERKSKQKLEMLHKKMVREFRDVKKAVARAFEDFERERKARQLMEEVCDELAREIGQDKARVEELKRESVKVREEVEEERKMLQMAEVWREERVQMKLMEAKLALEEKNTALDKIRSQLEAFLVTKRAGDLKDVGDHATIDTRLNVVGSCSVESVASRNLFESFHLGEQRSVDLCTNSVDSGCGHQSKLPRAWTSDSDDDDDLHSIELNNGPLRTASNEWGSHSF